MEENKEQTGGIDKDVLETLRTNDEKLNSVLDDDKNFKRFILNCFCEQLSVVKQLREATAETNNLISVIGADKISAFFKEVTANVNEETRRARINEKLAMSHRKKKSPKKTN